ncbi:CFI-box-CTERM domain-containing protein [Devosia riboflavina]
MQQSAAPFCFIATALDGEYQQEPMKWFLNCRDKLRSHAGIGARLVRCYYSFSPVASAILRRWRPVSAVTKFALLQIYRIGSRYV